MSETFPSQFMYYNFPDVSWTWHNQIRHLKFQLRSLFIYNYVNDIITNNSTACDLVIYIKPRCLCLSEKSNTCSWQTNAKFRMQVQKTYSNRLGKKPAQVTFSRSISSPSPIHHSWSKILLEDLKPLSVYPNFCSLLSSYPTSAPQWRNHRTNF